MAYITTNVDKDGLVTWPTPSHFFDRVDGQPRHIGGPPQCHEVVEVGELLGLLAQPRKRVLVSFVHILGYRVEPVVGLFVARLLQKGRNYLLQRDAGVKAAVLRSDWLLYCRVKE